MDITTLADIGTVSTDRNPRSRITVARFGKYKDARYGTFSIGEADYDGWKQNLDTTFGGKVSVDFDHSSDRGRGTEAAGWITGLERQGKDVIADVEWTPKGAAAVRDKSYQFISPTYTEHYKDETGADRGRALLGAACTNRPVLRQLPTLSLSHEAIDGAATVIAKGSAKRERKRARQLALARDSRPQMADDKRTALLKLLDLEDDATDVTILAAVHALPGDDLKHPSPSHTPGVDAKATPEANKKAAKKARKLAKNKDDDSQTMALDTEGHVLLSQDAYAELLKGSNAGQAAATQLAEQTFTTAWEKALSEGRAAPSQEQTVKELYDVNPELAVKTLDSFVKIVPTKPAGTGEGANAGPAPLGMDDERYQLHTQAKALAAEKIKANPKLDEAEAYTLAAVELEDRKFTLENPGI